MEANTTSDKNIERMLQSLVLSRDSNRQNESAATRREVETQTDTRSCIDDVHKLQSDALSKKGKSFV